MSPGARCSSPRSRSSRAAGTRIPPSCPPRAGPTPGRSAAPSPSSSGRPACPPAQTPRPLSRRSRSAVARKVFYPGQSRSSSSWWWRGRPGRRPPGQRAGGETRGPGEARGEPPPQPGGAGSSRGHPCNVSAIVSRQILASSLFQYLPRRIEAR